MEPVMVATAEDESAGAVVASPSVGLADLKQKASILLTRGDLEGALAVLDEALAQAPDDADLLALRGTSWARRGELSKVIDDLAAAVMLRPKDSELLNTLGVHLQHLKKFDEAVIFHVNAINNAPADQHPRLYVNLGLAMMGQGENEAAAELFQATLDANPDMLDAAVNLSSVLNALKDYRRSMEICRRALAYNESSELYHNLGNALHRLPGGDAEAVKAFERAAELDPTNSKSRHMLAVLRDEPLDEIPSSFVNGLFDEYASYYEQDVIEKLKYRVPGLIRKLVIGPFSAGKKYKAALDLGCGTGLMGVMLREDVELLKGVDISGNMLSRTLEKGIYDQVEMVDLLEGLGTDDRRFDLVTAADVCGYIGKLDGLFPRVFEKMEPGGKFAFSVEETFFGNFDVASSGRFAHSRLYVEQQLKAAGFTVTSVRRETLRTSAGRPVNGLIVLAQRPAEV